MAHKVIKGKDQQLTCDFVLTEPVSSVGWDVSLTIESLLISGVPELLYFIQPNFTGWKLWGLGSIESNKVQTWKWVRITFCSKASVVEDNEYSFGEDIMLALLFFYLPYFTTDIRHCCEAWNTIAVWNERCCTGKIILYVCIHIASTVDIVGVDSLWNFYNSDIINSVALSNSIATW